MAKYSAYGSLLLVLIGCGRIHYDPAPQSGMDAGVDAPSDAGHDSGADAFLPPTPGVTVIPVSGLSVAESGTSATFSVVLDTAPTANVTISLTSDQASEASVSPASLVFTPVNFAASQVVTVTGVDDSGADGDQDFTIVTSATSTDPAYDGIDVADVTGTNLDDESAGVVVSPIDGLIVTESGGTATFTVALQSAPSATVFIPITSSDEGEGTVSTPVVFDGTSWATPQLVTVTGVDDAVRDGDQVFQIHVGPAASTDTNYQGLAGSDVQVTNQDDESARILAAPSSGLITTELGASATFTVTLGSQPTADVTLSVVSATPAEGTALPATLAFSATTWNLGQIVTVTGVDDLVADGDQAYEVVLSVDTSADSDYAALADVPVSLTNTDNESPGITVSPTTSLTTTEGGGTDTFTVVLNSQPTGDVTIALSSDTSSEGSVAPASLTFNTDNWSMAQTVTVTGVDDARADGDRVYHVVTAAAVSSDPQYNLRNASDVSVVNTDDDSVGITVTPTILNMDEGGPSADFTVVLESEPLADVTVMFSNGVPEEGSIAPSSLVFTPSNWNTPQAVTVTPVDDAIANGDALYTVVGGLSVSTDLNYNGIDVTDVTVINTDNDSAGVMVTPISGLSTTEGGGTAMFSVVLLSQPESPVSISLMSDDTSEGTVSPASVTFNAGNWSTPQNVTVTGVNDTLVDGNIMYSIVTGAASSSDGVYNALAVSDVTLTNVDNDPVSIIVAPTSGLVTTELGGSATFSITLSGQPTAGVTIGLASSDTTEGTVSPASVAFTTGNWNVAQMVTVTGVNDFVDDGDIAYSIVTSPAVSTDIDFSGLDASDVAVTNTDNDTVGVNVSVSSGLLTDEAAQTATFTIVLASQPTADVSISLTSTNTQEGTVSPASVTFTSGNWNVAQTVTLTGVNDHLIDGDIAYSITTGAASSSDGLYNGFAVTDVSATNRFIRNYIKASNPESDDYFGSQSLRLSSDGSTAVACAAGEDSNATGIDGNQTNNSVSASGACYVFVRSGATWTQQAYIKPSVSAASTVFGSAAALTADGNMLVVSAAGASLIYVFVRTGSTWSQQSSFAGLNTESGDSLAWALEISADGTTLAASTWREQSNAVGVNGNGANNSLTNAGAAYVFTRSGMVWTQQAYIKASNTGNMDQFGHGLALSGDGDTLAVSAINEDSNATGIGGNQADNSAMDSGALYIFSRSAGVWTQQAYVKGSNTQANDVFGFHPGISFDGNTLAVGAPFEDSNATSIGGNEADNSALQSGATYVFTRSAGVWSQQAYIKASNADAGDYFGWGNVLSSDGNTLAIGAPEESSNATLIDGNAADNSMNSSGAVYLFRRSGSVWTQAHYIKASNTGASDSFSYFRGIALSSDASTIAVGTWSEDSSSPGINGNQNDNSASYAGAVYIYGNG